MHFDDDAAFSATTGFVQLHFQDLETIAHKLYAQFTVCLFHVKQSMNSTFVQSYCCYQNASTVYQRTSRVYIVTVCTIRFRRRTNVPKYHAATFRMLTTIHFHEVPMHPPCAHCYCVPNMEASHKESLLLSPRYVLHTVTRFVRTHNVLE